MSAAKLKVFDEKEYSLFESNMAREIEGLKEAVQSKGLCETGTSFGAEIEAWVADQNYIPMAKNREVLDCLAHCQFVPELSQYNLEYNGKVYCGEDYRLKNLEKEFKSAEDLLNNTSKKIGGKILLIGSMPNLEISQINLSHMTPKDRYFTINHQIMARDNFEKRNFQISGSEDQIQFESDSIMPVAATTSYQMHYKMPYSEFADHFNASLYCSSFLVAISANSPFLFGKSLWEESRIPLFEQSIKKGSESVPRIGLGYGFIGGDVSEYYQKISKDFQVYYPELRPLTKGGFAHNNLHNATVWHWNRVVVGEASVNSSMHARIEFRPCSAGPSAVDMVAHNAMYLGLTRYFSQKNVKDRISFEQVQKNFYNCAKNGLDAEIVSIEGKTLLVKDLWQTYLSYASEGLSALGISSEEINYYLHEILAPRLAMNRNGARWQRQSFAKAGDQFYPMLDRYWHQQRENKPLYLWDL